MVVLGGSSYSAPFVRVAERLRAASGKLVRRAVLAAGGLFDVEQVYREIAEAESRHQQREMIVLGWMVTFHGDGTALAENRLTGETLPLSAEDTQALKGTLEPTA